MPLQSGMNYSDPGNDCSIEADRQVIAGYAGNEAALFVAPSGMAMMLRGRYPATESLVANGPFLRIGVCMSPGADLVQQINGSRVEGRWRTGSIVVTPPAARGLSRCSPVDMIGLAILPSLFEHVDNATLDGLEDRFHDDPLLTAVTQAIYHEATVHGAQTAFFEHGLALILRRFTALRSAPTTVPPARPLSLPKLDRARSYVESRLGNDILVAEMAAIIGMDSSGFTRALRARTGLPPYAWLTKLRMDRAGELLTAGWTVMQVAAALGYSNAGKFAAAFRRVKGCAPSAWAADR